MLNTLADATGSPADGRSVDPVSRQDAASGPSGRRRLYVQSSGAKTAYRSATLHQWPAAPTLGPARRSVTQSSDVPPNDEPGLVTALRAIGGEWQSGRLSWLQSSARIDAYDRRAQTRRLAEILDRLIARQPANR